MARLPGPIPDERFQPGQFPMISPARATVGGIERAATAVQDFDRALRADRLVVQREQAATELDNILTDAITEARANPGQIDGLVENFDQAIQGSVDQLSEGMQSNKEQAIFRARGMRAVNATRNQLADIQSQRQIQNHLQSLDNNVASIVSRAIATNQPLNEMMTEVSQVLNDAVETGRILPADAEKVSQGVIGAWEGGQLAAFAEEEDWEGGERFLEGVMHTPPETSIRFSSVFRKGRQNRNYLQARHTITNMPGDMAQLAGEAYSHTLDLTQAERFALLESGREATEMHVSAEVARLRQQDPTGASATDFIMTYPQPLRDTFRREQLVKAQGDTLASDRAMMIEEVRLAIANNDPKEADRLIEKHGGALLDAEVLRLKGFVAKLREGLSADAARSLGNQIKDQEKAYDALGDQFTYLAGIATNRILTAQDAGIPPSLEDVTLMRFFANPVWVGNLQRHGVLDGEHVERISADVLRFAGANKEVADIQARRQQIIGPGRHGANPLEKRDREAVDLEYQDRVLGGVDPDQAAFEVFRITGILPPQRVDAINGTWNSSDAEVVDGNRRFLELIDREHPADVWNQLSEPDRIFYQHLADRLPGENFDEVLKDARELANETREGPPTESTERRRQNIGRWNGFQVIEDGQVKLNSAGDPILENGITDRRIYRTLQEVAKDKLWHMTDDDEDFFEQVSPFVFSDGKRGSPAAASAWKRLTRAIEDEFMRIDPAHLAVDQQLKRAAKKAYKEIVGGGIIGLETVLRSEPTLALYPTSSLQDPVAPELPWPGNSVPYEQALREDIYEQIIAPFELLGEGLPTDPNATLGDFVQWNLDRVERDVSMLPPNEWHRLDRKMDGLAIAMALSNDTLRALAINRSALADILPDFQGDGLTRQERTQRFLDERSPVSIMLSPVSTGAFQMNPDGSMAVQYNVYVRSGNEIAQVYEVEWVDDGTGQPRVSQTTTPMTYIPNLERAPSVRNLRAREEEQKFVNRAEHAGVFRNLPNTDATTAVFKDEAVVERLRGSATFRKRMATELAKRSVNQAREADPVSPKGFRLGDADAWLTEIEDAVGIERTNP